jgi:hypothetical protein
VTLGEGAPYHKSFGPGLDLKYNAVTRNAINMFGSGPRPRVRGVEFDLLGLVSGLPHLVVIPPPSRTVHQRITNLLEQRRAAPSF